MQILVKMWPIQPMVLKGTEMATLALRQLDYWDELQQEKKVIFTAPYAGKPARIAIYEVASDEEFFDLINRDPLFRYFDREIILLSTNERLRELILSRSQKEGS